MVRLRSLAGFTKMGGRIEMMDIAKIGTISAGWFKKKK